MKISLGLQGWIRLWGGLTVGPMLIYAMLARPGFEEGGWLILFAIVAALLGLLAGDRLVVAWMERLKEKVGRIAVGDLDVQLAADSPIPQLQALGEGLQAVVARYRADSAALGACRARHEQVQAEACQIEEQLRQRTEELAVLLETVPMPVWMARDAACWNIVGNRAGNLLLGLPADANMSLTAPEAEDSPPFRLYTVDGREMAGNESPMQRVAIEGCPLRDIEVELRFPDGRQLWLLENVAPLFDPNGAVRGVLAASLDITLRKQTEDVLRRHRDQLEGLVAERTYELAVAREAAERANRGKSIFLASVTQELQAPLNNLLFLARSLAGEQGGGLTPQQHEYARMIELSGQDLLVLIDELRDLARIETGRLKMDLKAVAFPEIMQNLRRTHGQAAREKGLDFKMEIDADVPATLDTDPRRLEQLLRKLLSNAIKFTAEGSVTLRIRRAVSGWRYNNPTLAGAKGVVAFDVIDTGIGIDPQRQREIFKTPDSLAGRAAEEDSGLGLAISRGIAALLGGELGVASVQGSGSTFTVYLPLDYAEAYSSSAGGGAGSKSPVPQGNG